jgi:hypothetical protein
MEIWWDGIEWIGKVLAPLNAFIMGKARVSLARLIDGEVGEESEDLTW